MRFIDDARFEHLEHLLATLHAQVSHIMPVLDDLKASVSQLSADVQAYIAKQQPPADSVSAADAEAIIAQLQAIDALVNPPAAPAA